MSSANSGAAGSQRLRTPRLIEIVLVLSLALNAFIAGGFLCSVWFFSRPHGPPPGAPEHHLEQLARTIGIDPRTSLPFQQLRATLRLNIDALRQKNQPLLDPFWVEISKPQPDTAQIQQMLTEVTANREDFQRKAIQAVVTFMLQLTPEQRANLIRILNDHRNPQGQPLRNLFGN